MLFNAYFLNPITYAVSSIGAGIHFMYGDTTLYTRPSVPKWDVQKNAAMGKVGSEGWRKHVTVSQ